VAWRLLKRAAQEASMLTGRKSREAGYSLIEIAVVIVIIGILAALAVPAMEEWMANARLKEAARQVADAFTLARENAIRTGDYQIVFFQKDMLGAALLGGNAIPVPILTLDDGRPSTAGQNCRITAAKNQTSVNAETGVNWGVTFATAKAPNDVGLGPWPPVTGSTFTDSAGNATTWVMFGPNGIPIGVSVACAVGTTGSGGGTIYLTNPYRDYAISLSPLGGVYVSTWNTSAVPAAWRQ
jgi:prepilin-type N-terminal cleavage/methylation domain-containing protein